METCDDDISPEMMQDVAASAYLIKKRQDTRASKDGQFTVSGVFKAYKCQTRDSANKITSTFYGDTPPKRHFIPSKTTPGQSFPAPLCMQIQVTNISPIPGVVELLEDGSGFRMLHELSYQSNEPKAWFEAHFWEYYDQKFKTRIPMETYIDPEGNILETKWVNIHFGSIVTMEVPDPDDNTIFRKKTPQGLLEVGPLSKLTFTGCIAKQNITMRDERDGENQQEDQPQEEQAVPAAEDAATAPTPAAPAATVSKVRTRVPIGYNSINCKGQASLSDDHDPNMPVTERMHRNVPKDVHHMIPIEKLRTGAPCSYNFQIYSTKKYQSAIRGPNAVKEDGQGISLFKLPVDDIKDFYRVYDSKETVSYASRLNVFQWIGQPNTNEKYSAKMVCKKDNEAWRAFGITDPVSYGYIAHANPDIPSWTDVALWKGPTLKMESNKPETIHDNPALWNIAGHYTYGIEKMWIDFIRYYPQRALQVSKDWATNEFGMWMATNNMTGKTVLTLEKRDPTKLNPLHSAGLASPVIALGNKLVDPNDIEQKPLNHAVTGDIWPIMDKCEFFVLTSHRITAGEVVDNVPTVNEFGPYCGDTATASQEERDAFVTKLIEKDKVLYWVYAIKKDILEKYVPGRKGTIPTISSKIKETAAAISNAKASKKEKEKEAADDSIHASLESDDRATPKKGKRVEREVEEDDRIPPPYGALTSPVKKAASKGKKK